MILGNRISVGGKLPSLPQFTPSPKVSKSGIPALQPIEKATELVA